MAALVIEFPFLNIWPLSVIWKFFARRLMKRVVLELKQGSGQLIITFTNEKHNEAAKAAAEVLKEKQASGEDQTDALENFRRAYGDLVRMRVTGPTRSRTP